MPLLNSGGVDEMILGAPFWFAISTFLIVSKSLVTVCRWDIILIPKVDAKRAWTSLPSLFFETTSLYKFAKCSLSTAGLPCKLTWNMRKTPAPMRRCKHSNGYATAMTGASSNRMHKCYLSALGRTTHMVISCAKRYHG